MQVNSIFNILGTHYRGRVLYNLDFKQQLDPKAKVIKLKYSMPDNPPPNPKEKVYILRADLYNGFELPEKLSSASIHITCGPYKAASPLADVREGWALWNYSFEDLKISAPADISQVFDVIIYLSSSQKPQDRIWFLRIPVKDLLYSENKILKIKKYTLVEDISIDAIGDEDFPGIINMRLTLFNKSPPKREKDSLPSENEIKKLYREYILRVFLYMGRDLPAADSTGLADPFVKPQNTLDIDTPWYYYKKI